MASLKCPNCDKTFSNRRGYGPHGVHAHGWDPDAIPDPINVETGEAVTPDEVISPKTAETAPGGGSGPNAPRKGLRGLFQRGERSKAGREKRPKAPRAPRTATGPREPWTDLASFGYGQLGSTLRGTRPAAAAAMVSTSTAFGVALDRAVEGTVADRVAQPFLKGASKGGDLASVVLLPVIADKIWRDGYSDHPHDHPAYSYFQLCLVRNLSLTLDGLAEQAKEMEDVNAKIEALAQTSLGRSLGFGVEGVNPVDSMMGAVFGNLPPPPEPGDPNANGTDPAAAAATVA